MYDEAKTFLERFRETRLDVIVRTSTEEVLRAAEFVLVVGGFGYLADLTDSLAAGMAYWIMLTAFMVYAGNRTSYFLTGWVRGRGPHKAWHPWVILPGAVIVSVAFAGFTRLLIDAVIAAKGAG